MKAQTEINGKIWKVGDDVDTDLVIAGPYLTVRDPQKQASHVFEAIFPRFSEQVKRGDLIVAGRNFGCGSSREDAPRLLKQLGIGAVVAESFARIFMRNAINLGLPVMECKGISRVVEQGEQLTVNLSNGEVRRLTTGEVVHGARLPDFLLSIIEAGGALEALKANMKVRG